MIYPFSFQPDQGYYTQQPATVDQVNNLWDFVKLMRRELSRTIEEFNKYPDRQDEFAKRLQNFVDNIELHADKLHELQEADDATAGKIEAIDEELVGLRLDVDAAISNIKLIDNPDSPSGFIIRETLTDSTTRDKRFTFEDSEALDAVKTTVTSRDGGTTIGHTVPGVNKIAEAIAEADEAIHEDLERHRERLDELETVSTSNSYDITGINVDISDLREIKVNGIEPGAPFIEENALTQSFTLERGGDREKFYNYKIVGGKEIDLDVTADTPSNVEITINAEDQFARAWKEDLEIHAAFVHGLSITTNDCLYTYNTDTRQLEFVDQYNNHIMRFANRGDSKHPAFFEKNGENVTINTDAIQQEHARAVEALTNRLDAYQKRIVELEQKMARLERSTANAVTNATLTIEPREVDKLAFILGLQHANGAHDEQEYRVNFTNQDGALEFLTRDQGIDRQAEMFININNEWLTKQELDSTISA